MLWCVETCKRKWWKLRKAFYSESQFTSNTIINFDLKVTSIIKFSLFYKYESIWLEVNMRLWTIEFNGKKIEPKLGE